MLVQKVILLAYRTEPFEQQIKPLWVPKNPCNRRTINNESHINGITIKIQTLKP